jgi:hypothetical protein
MLTLAGLQARDQVSRIRDGLVISNMADQFDPLRFIGYGSHLAQYSAITSPIDNL